MACRQGTVIISAARKALTPALCACALLVAALLCARPALAAPQVRVGDAGGGRVEIEVHGATIRQVLDALREAHLIQFRASAALSLTVTGTYSGTLPQVLSRILDRYNYFLQVTASGTRLRIVDAAASDAVTGSFVTAVPMAASARRPASTNVDLDDEKAEAAAGPAVKPVPPRSDTTPYPVVRATTTSRPASTRVSTNVDRDEETSQ